MHNTDDIQWVPFPERVVTAVDKIVAKARIIGVEGRVETAKHWDLVEEIYRLWATFYPHEYIAYRDTQIELKQQQANHHGSAKEGEAEVQHVVEIPRRFFHLLQAIFPEVDRQLTGSKTFAMKLAKRIPLFKVPEKI